MIKLEYKRKRKISHKTHLYFSDPTPQHTHTSSLDSCTARETDCCHSNYICAQLGMCFCASASASPWSSTNRPRAPREGREKHVCRRQGTRQDGSPDTNHVLALFSPKPFPSKSQVTGYYQDPKSKPQKISQKDASEVNVQSRCGQIQETKRTWEVWLGRRHNWQTSKDRYANHSGTGRLIVESDEFTFLMCTAVALSTQPHAGLIHERMPAIRSRGLGEEGLIWEHKGLSHICYH